MYPKFTKQETFDIVAKHLLTQGKQSRSYLGCAYRGDDGAKCAAGALIPDDQYTIQIESKSVLSTKYFGDSDDFFGHDRMLVRELQQIHDHIQPDAWMSELQALASLNLLQFNFA